MSIRVGLRPLSRILVKPPVHPPYVCFYNSCQNCDEWTLDAGVSCSLSTDKKEGALSSELVFPAAPAAVTLASKTLTYNASCLWIGNWLKCVWATGDPQVNIYFGVYEADEWLVWNIYYNTTLAKYRLRAYSHDPTDHVTADFCDISLNTWYWFEMQEILGEKWRLWLNGSLLHDYVYPFQERTWDSFKLRQPLGWYTERVRVDYIRTADREEYPPR